MTKTKKTGAKPARKNAKQPWVDAVIFALTECVRFQGLLREAVKTKQFDTLPKDDLLYTLRHPKGHDLICGRAANDRLRSAAADALGRSKVARSVSIDRVFKAIKAAVINRFVVAGVNPTLSTVEKAFSAAIKEASEARADSRHLIPCQLMFVADPDNFSIGPVTFHNRVAFKPIGEVLVAEHRRVAEEGGRSSTADDVLAYYANFTWIADLTVVGCDKEIGEERALQAVNAALDFLHLLFGHYHSRKMVVGGPSLESDVRATMEVREGRTLLSYSVGATSAVGFEKGWAEMMTRFGSRELITSAGRAIEAITDPATERPLGLRFIEAASWHGQAVREASPAAAIVKSVLALERLVTIEKSSDTTRVVCERSAALSYDPAGDKRLNTVIKEMKSVYDLRSRLVHGTLSPFDPEVRARRREVLAAVERSLINGLAIFDQDGLLDRSLTRKQLRTGLEGLISWSRGVDDQRHASRRRRKQRIGR